MDKLQQFKRKDTAADWRVTLDGAERIQWDEAEVTGQRIWDVEYKEWKKSFLLEGRD